MWFYTHSVGFFKIFFFLIHGLRITHCTNANAKLEEVFIHLPEN